MTQLQVCPTSCNEAEVKYAGQPNSSRCLPHANVYLPLISAHGLQRASHISPDL